MLHAVIRRGPETLHFIGPASMENLRELARHLSRVPHNGAPTSLQVALDATDYKFSRLVRRWKKRSSGTTILLRVRRIHRLRAAEPPPPRRTGDR